jgi:hypothetical protein
MIPSKQYVGFGGMSDSSTPRIVKSAIIRARWPEIEEALATGRCLHDVWLGLREELGISYRQFTRALVGFPQTRYSARTATPSTAAPKGGKTRLPAPPIDGAFDPLLNLREHENRPKGFDYKGSRPPEELI